MTARRPPPDRAVRPRGRTGTDAGAHPGPMPESAAWNATAHTLSGLLLFGGLGWLGDRLLGISALLPVGLFVGVAAGMSMVFVRYGTQQQLPPADVEPGGPSRDSRRSPDDRRTPEEDE